MASEEHGAACRNHTQVAVVGGGLAGLALAERLQQAGFDFQLFEARERLGGRVESVTCMGVGFDLGPAWFWSTQPRMAGLCDRLGLAVFEQYSTGDLLFEDTQRQVQRGRGYASMEGSLRIEGGAGALTDVLASRLPEQKVHLQAPVRRVFANGQLTLDDGSCWHADRIVLALPPRVAAELHFEPALGASERRLLADTPTWMAGVAKFLAVYDEPFWRQEGLSGDVMSRSGPLMEIHDATPRSGGPGALFGFYGVPAHIRRDHPDELVAATQAQLERLFGSQARAPVQTFLRDWAVAPETATEADQIPPTQHPTYGLPHSLTGAWEGRLLFGASEMAGVNGGYMEGALEQAEAITRVLLEAYSDG
ncbi:FAD-dependent oxidoreductase [Salicola sp. Rm-C-2C1-2]|uniref:flavin monoamine oxidase family protein n=1 Tax=Salicola sp. Rm-C-2C1-2 TaxID=3141321 RepID=UPI0032E3CF39